MMTVKQVSLLTGVSIRTLQFYDEIGLLKPAKLTDSGYRLYDDGTIETLQQILFFKELDFTLKEIKAIMEDPQLDRKTVFLKQRELIQMKRDRYNELLSLLDRLIKGERCMNFTEFDMSEYFRVLTEFKKTHVDEIVSRLGSMENFDHMVSELRSNEGGIADMAVKQYGGIENFTRTMEKNFEDFLNHGPVVPKKEVNRLIDKTEEITKRLMENKNKNAADPEVQEVVRELISFTDECNKGIDMGENYWQFMAELYSENPTYIEATDKKYGSGASKFLGLAIQAYLKNERR